MVDNQLWGGRFENPLNPNAFALGQSIYLDIRLLPFDIAQSRAYLQALGDANLVPRDLCIKIAETLNEIEREYFEGTLVIEDTDEDVHGLIERILVQRIGAEATTIRMGRSRNDQVATDLKLLLRNAAGDIQVNLTTLIRIIAQRSEDLVNVYATSYTHTQRAQPIVFSQELLKHGFALSRNVDRFTDWHKRHNTLPLGAGASAGNSLPINFEALAGALNFDSLAFNSLDATSSRDFVSEFLFICAQISIDVSRISEEIILWSTREFGFVTLPDEFSTGSSLMPQKRNPDFAELARGKTGRMIGNLVNILTLLKALPFGYNRDLQEDKFPVFDAIDTLNLVLPVISGMVRDISFNRETIEKSVNHGHILATDIAEWLVSQGLAFKEAHDIAGQLVVLAESLSLDVSELTFEQFKSVSKVFEPEVIEVLTVRRSIDNRTSPGAASPQMVKEQIARLRNLS